MKVTEEQFEQLKKRSITALDMSYSPYSSFRVGCCILMESGDYFEGANIENASYGASICAERTTITQAVLKGQKSLKAIAISSDMEEDFISPCGICRQFVREFSEDVPVYMFKKDGSCHESSIAELLPFSFGPSHLHK